MTHAERRSGVAAGKLHQTIQRLHTTLAEFRTELQQSEDNYQLFESRWRERDAEIAHHLDLIETQLKRRPAAPLLSVVRADD
jgi:hypothetical protein